MKTKSGLLLRAVGDNKSFVTSLARDQGNRKILGLAIGNGLVALSGCVLAQQAESASVNSGTGMVVMALASVIIGRTLFSRLRIMKAPRPPSSAPASIRRASPSPCSSACPPTI